MELFVIMNEEDKQGTIEVSKLMTWIKEFSETRINFRLQNQRRCIQPHVILEMGKKGVFGIQVPKEYGGLELSNIDSCKVIEQLGGIDLTLAAFVGQNNMGILPIVAFGSSDIKNELLPDLAAGKTLASFALTEPDAGSDAQGIQGSLEQTSHGKYLLNAKKTWIGMGSWSGIACVVAKYSTNSSTQNKMAVCIVRAGAKGFIVGEECLSMGMRGAVQNHMEFRNIEIPEQDILGNPEEGYLIANKIMQTTRLGVGATALGAMKRCLLLVYRYATRRSINTGLLLDNPVTKIRIHEFIARIKSLESLVYTAADMMDQGKNTPELNMIAKIAGSEFLGEVTDQTIQILGSRGYGENNIAPYFFLDARALRIFEGPSETLLHYCGCLMKLRRSRTNLFQTLEANDLVHYFEEASEALNKNCPAESSLAQEYEDFASFTKGKVIYWIILLSTLRIAHKNSPIAEYSLTWSWLENNLQTLLSQIKNPSINYSGLLQTSQVESLLNSFSFVDIEQHLPDEDTKISPLLRK